MQRRRAGASYARTDQADQERRLVHVVRPGRRRRARSAGNGGSLWTLTLALVMAFSNPCLGSRDATTIFDDAQVCRIYWTN
jgi:hypothetical protein